MKRTLISLAFAVATLASTGHADDNANWTRPIKPYRVVGNIYYVGSEGLSAWLITSSAGHILLDSGPSAEGGKLIERNIRTLGFQLSDVKVLINSHSHFDHAGGLAELAAKSGAEVFASARDANQLEAGGKGDFAWGDEGAFPPVEVDRRLAIVDPLRIRCRQMHRQAVARRPTTSSAPARAAATPRRSMARNPMTTSRGGGS